MAAETVRAGITQTAAAATFSVRVRAVRQVEAVDKIGGLLALAAKQRRRPVGAGWLSADQATKTQQQIRHTNRNA